MTVQYSSVTINTKWDTKEISAVKNYLSRGINLGIAIEALTDHIKELNEANTSLHSPDYSLGTRISSRLSDGKAGSIAVLALKEKLRDQLCELNSIYGEISAVIDMAQDPFLRTILKYRYLDGMIWEQIGYLTGYSVRQIYRKHKEALKSIADYVPEEWKKKADML